MFRAILRRFSLPAAGLIALCLALATLAAPSAARAQGLCIFDATGACRMSLVQSTGSAAIDTAASGSALLVAGVAGQTTRITAIGVYAGGTTNFKLIAGTGTACATGTVSLTGAFPFKDQGGYAHGTGTGVLLVPPVGADVCLNNSAAVQVSGLIAWSRF